MRRTPVFMWNLSSRNPNAIFNASRFPLRQHARAKESISGVLCVALYDPVHAGGGQRAKQNLGERAVGQQHGWQLRMGHARISNAVHRQGGFELVVEQGDLAKREHVHHSQGWHASMGSMGGEGGTSRTSFTALLPGVGFAAASSRHFATCTSCVRAILLTARTASSAPRQMRLVQRAPPTSQREANKQAGRRQRGQPSQGHYWCGCRGGGGLTVTAGTIDRGRRGGRSPR